MARLIRKSRHLLVAVSILSILLGLYLPLIGGSIVEASITVLVIGVILSAVAHGLGKYSLILLLVPIAFLASIYHECELDVGCLKIPLPLYFISHLEIFSKTSFQTASFTFSRILESGIKVSVNFVISAWSFCVSSSNLRTAFSIIFLSFGILTDFAPVKAAK